MPASGAGGAWLVDGNMRYETCGEFPARTKMEHSTLRELTAVRLACEEWIEKIQGKTLLVCSDCQTVVADLQQRQVGTARLLEEASKIITLVIPSLWDIFNMKFDIAIHSVSLSMNMCKWKEFQKFPWVEMNVLLHHPKNDKI